VRIEQLRANYQIDVQFVHFPLHAETPDEGMTLEELFAGRNIDIPAAKARMVRLMAEEGLPYGDRSMTFNSRLTQELAKWIETQQPNGNIRMIAIPIPIQTPHAPVCDFLFFQVHLFFFPLATSRGNPGGFWHDPGRDFLRPAPGRSCPLQGTCQKLSAARRSAIASCPLEEDRWTCHRGDKPHRSRLRTCGCRVFWLYGGMRSPNV